MSIGSRWTLLFFAVWIAIAGSVADAATLRRRDGESGSESESKSNEREQQAQQTNGETTRMLKHSKGASGPVGSPTTTSVTVTGNSVTVTAQTNAVESGIQNFEMGCKGKAQALEKCLISVRGDQSRCKQCLLGIASLTNPNLSNLKSCTSTKISGGMCNPTCQAHVTNYFNCGAGTSFVLGNGNSNSGTTTTTTATATSTSVTQSGFAPMESCNAYNGLQATPKSGDDCLVPGSYQYQQCFFQGARCTCRYDESKWLCQDYP